MANNYYPFGLTFNSYNRVTAKQNDYLYNGKELQSELELNWLDYGARMYIPEIGRWGVIDPMSEKFVSHTPYNYALNNPVNLIDPDGMAAVKPKKPFSGRGRRNKHGKVSVTRFTTADRVSANISVALGSMVPGVGVGFGLGAEYAKAGAGMDHSASSSTAQEAGMAFAEGFTVHGMKDGMVVKEMNEGFGKGNKLVKGVGAGMATRLYFERVSYDKS